MFLILAIYEKCGKSLGCWKASVREAAHYLVSPSNSILLKRWARVGQAPWKNPGASGREVAERPAKTFSPGAERLFGGHLGSWLTDVRRQTTSDGEILRVMLCSVIFTFGAE